MAASNRGALAIIKPKDDPKKEFPLVCETCLGDNRRVRMQFDPQGLPCKICDRPFTVFRWRPGPRARFKKTEVCMTCARMKHVCQTCVLDLTYGVPVEVRDSALKQIQKISQAKTTVNRDWINSQYEKKVAEGDFEAAEALITSAYGKAATSAVLERLSRRTPYYKRNDARVCSFWQRGECNRGASCPYKHEDPGHDPSLKNQNIKDRYFGENDPVAAKMMRKERGEGDEGGSGGAAASSSASSRPAPTPPEDGSITTVFVGGVSELFTTEQLRQRFAPYGEIRELRAVPAKACAFVTYSARESAESAVLGLHNKLEINGTRMRVDWSRRKPQGRQFGAPPGMGAMYDRFSQPDRPTSAAASQAAPALVSQADANKYLVQMPAPPPPTAALPPPPGMGPASYPSQNPNTFTTRIDSRKQ